MKVYIIDHVKSIIHILLLIARKFTNYRIIYVCFIKILKKDDNDINDDKSYYIYIEIKKKL